MITIRAVTMPWRARIVVRILACVAAHAPDAVHQLMPFGRAVERQRELGRRLDLGPAGVQLGADRAQPVSGQGAPPLVDTPQGTGRGSMDSVD